MKYYQYVDIPNWEIIAERILNLIKSKMDLTNTEHFTLLDVEEIKGLTPELFDWAHSIDNDIDLVAVVITNHQFAGIHVDLSFNDSDNYRVNIPLLNCEHSSTIFYTNVPKPINKLSPNGMPYGDLGDPKEVRTNAKEIDRLILNKPAFLRVVDPHDIECHVFPRISFTARFTKPLDQLVEKL